MGKHRYKHSSQIRATCANPPAQGRCKYGKCSFSSTCLPLQLPCHPVQNAFLGYKRGSLGISPFCWTEYDWCWQDRYNKMHVCARSTSLLQQNQIDGMTYPLLQKARDKRVQGVRSQFCAQSTCLYPLLPCTCWKSSPSLLATCLSVYKHRAEITSNLPFLLSLFFVFIRAPCLRHLPYHTDHHTVFLSQSSNIRFQHDSPDCIFLQPLPDLSTTHCALQNIVLVRLLEVQDGYK